MNPIEVEIVRNVGFGSFRAFAEFFWHAISPNPFVGGYFVDAVCEHLQAVKEGQIKRLALVCPIRHGKTSFTSIMFPAWAWLHDPTLRTLGASHTMELAQTNNTETRKLIESPLFKACYGDLFAISESQDEKRHYQNDKGGERRAVSVGTRTSGMNADHIIVDDLIDYDHAQSEIDRKKALDYYASTLSKRIVHGTGKDRIVVAGHRVHEDDLFAHVYNTWGNDGTWTYLYLPAEANPSISNDFNNAIGWKDTREEGELLFPERIGKKEIEDDKKEMRHAFHCLYNQDPTPREGGLFQASWLRHYTEDATHYLLGDQKFRKSKAWRIATLDTAISTASDADYTVCQIWDTVGHNLVLVDQMREKLDGNRIVKKVKAFVEYHKPQFVCVEAEFIGRFVIDQLKDSNIPVKRFQASGQGGKETRAVAAEIRMSQFEIWFPKDRAWVGELEKEVLVFPHGAHDDMVDAMVMAAIVSDKYKGRIEIELTPEEQAEKERRESIEAFNSMLWDGLPF